MLLCDARRKGGAICIWRNLAPAISRENHSTYCSVGIRLLQSRAGAREVSRDMEQNSEDAQGAKRSAEIHSGEVQQARVSSAQAPRQAKLFCGISVVQDC